MITRNIQQIQTNAPGVCNYAGIIYFVYTDIFFWLTMNRVCVFVDTKGNPYGPSSLAVSSAVFGGQTFTIRSSWKGGPAPQPRRGQSM